MKTACLLQALYAWLKAAAASFELPAAQELHAAPGVFLGDLPLDRAEDLPDLFPFALIFWAGGENDEGQAMDEAEIVLGVYVRPGLQPNNLPAQAEAELLCAAFADHLRAELMRQRLLDSRFDLQLPLAVKKPLPENKQHQYHVMTINTRWQYVLPARPLNQPGDWQKGD